MRTIRDILAKRQLYSVQKDRTVKEVVDYLCEHRVSAVPVMDGEQVVGVFSERDLVQRVVHKGLDPNTVKVGEVMTKDCLHIPPDEDHRLAKTQMVDAHVRHLIVTDENGKLCGLISMRDLMREDVADYAELVARLNDKYYQDAFKRVGKR